MDRLEEFQQLAIELATASGQMIREAVAKGDFSVEEKRSRRDLVTEVDKTIEKFIFERLKAAYPEGHVFIGEESAGTANRITSDASTWIVDPIDGTMNFTHTYPLVSVSIGLAVERQLVVGVIYAPFLGKLYTAIKGRGARCNGSPIHVSQGVHRLSEALVLSEVAFFGGEHRNAYIRRLFDEVLWKASSVRMIGSSCCCLGLLAEGAADLFLHAGLCIWDMAAGAVIVTEAGGVLRTINGDPFDPHGRSLLAASSEALIEEVAPHTAIIRKKE